MSGRVQVCQSVQTLIRGRNSCNFLRALSPLSSPVGCRRQSSDVTDNARKDRFDSDHDTTDIQSHENKRRLGINERLRNLAENDTDTPRVHNLPDPPGVSRMTRPVKPKDGGSGRRNALQNQFRFSSDSRRAFIASIRTEKEKEREFKQMNYLGKSINRQYDSRESLIPPATQQVDTERDVQSDGPDLLQVEQELQQNFNPQQAEDILPGLGKRKQRPGWSSEEDQRHLNVPVVKGEILFGLHPVLLALKFGRRDAHCLYVQDKGDNPHSDDRQRVISLAEEMAIPIKYLTLAQMDKCTNYRPHQGVCLDVSRVKPLPYTPQETEHTDAILDSTENNRLPLWLVLYQVQDPMNFGAVLRSAYLFGVQKVLITSQNSCSLTPVVSKASAGVMEVIDVFSINQQITDFIQAQQQLGWAVVGTAGQRMQREDMIASETGDATSHIVPDTSQLGGATSHIVVDTSQLGGATSYIVPDTSQLGGATSHIVPDISQLGGATSDIVPDTSQLGGATSHIVVDTSQLGGATSHIVPDTSQLGGTTSHIVSDTSELGGATSHIVPDTSQLGGTTISPVTDTSEPGVTASHASSQVTGTSEPGVAASSPVRNTSEPEGGTSSPVTDSSEPGVTASSLERDARQLRGTTSSPVTYTSELGEQGKATESVVYHPIPVQEYSFDKPTILIVGNEGSGLPVEVLRACDQVLYAELADTIKGDNYGIHSLNVSVATGILLHCLTLLKRRKVPA